MKQKPQMTLAEMAAKAAGTGRLVCPKCGCPDFKTYKTSQGVAATFRYKACRHCGHKLFTMQQAEQAIRSIENEPTADVDDLEGDLL